MPADRAISYWPFREAIRRHFGIGEDDPEDIAWERLRSGLGYIFPEGVDDLLPCLGTLLALHLPEEYIERTRYPNGRAMGQQVYRSCLRLLECPARQRPLMVVLEQLFAGQIEEFYPMLAHHFAQAHDWGQAQRYQRLCRMREDGGVGAERLWRALGQVAVRLFEPAQSSSHFRLAAEIGLGRVGAAWRTRLR